MPRAFSNWIAIGAAGIAMLLMACSAIAGDNLEHKNLVASAISEHSEVSKRAIAALRSEGRAGIESLYDAHRAEIEKHVAEGSIHDPAPAWQRWLTACDGIAGQRDCYASQLFWYTDLEKAKAESKATGKPILSLR